MLKEGKPPGCCDRPNCPWKHVNDPPDTATRSGAMGPGPADPEAWAVCKHIVDPTTYGQCDGRSCGRSHCEVAAAVIRKQFFPHARNSG